MQIRVLNRYCEGVIAITINGYGFNRSRTYSYPSN